MNKKNIYVDIHVLQNVPPSCINRDDTGSPKTAVYGGTTRARVSSQAWKSVMRKTFSDIFDEKDVGIRTKRVTAMIKEKIQQLDSSIDDEKAMKLASKACEYAGIALEKKKKNDEEEISKVLMFFSHVQAEMLAKLILDDNKDKKAYALALKQSPSVDIALFGRMVASDPSLNFDAAAQVAHSISTHTVHNEYDYFTASDDMSEEDNAGAGHLGTVEFNSSTLYRYATVNAKELSGNLKNLTPLAVRGFAEAFIYSMPTGKQNSFANRTLPDFVYITIRNDQPINLCGAFEKPVSNSDGGYLSGSQKALADYSGTVYENYDCPPVKAWAMGTNAEKFGQKSALPQILDELEKAVKELIDESEAN